MAERESTYNNYVLAKQALWAGDVDFARTRLEMIGGYRDAVERVDPESVVRWRAVNLRDFLSNRKFNQPDGEFIVQTEHLRGLFSRTSERGFEMRAFLLDLAWDEKLLWRARSIADRWQRAERSAGDAQDIRWRQDQTANWIEFMGDAQVDVVVSEFALVRARLIWIRQEPPRSLHPIRTAFRSILEMLDDDVRGVG
jgi:hypothetical protein